MTPPPTLTRPAPLWRRWLLAPVHFWTRPVRAEPLALFRILFGATLLLSVLVSYAPYLGLYLGDDPLLPSAQVDDWMSVNAGRFCLLRGPKNLPPFDQMPAEYADAWKHWCERPANEYLLFGVWVASLACVTLGLWTRPSTIVALLLTVSFHLRIVQTTNGGDSVARCGLFYLMLAPAGAVWSLDAWMARRRRQRRGLPPDPSPVFIPAWSVRLLQIQLCLMYFFTGLVKIVDDLPTLFLTGRPGADADWLTGHAVYWVLNDIELNRVPFAWLAPPMWLCQALSWGTLVFEIGFSFLVLSRRLRPWVLLAGISFHLGIWATTEVGWFSPMSICWYAVFLTGSQLDAIAAFLRKRRLPIDAPPPSPRKSR